MKNPFDQNNKDKKAKSDAFARSTQWLPIKDLKSSYLITKDSAIAGVKLSAVNLELRSNLEQSLAIGGFNSAINSIQVPWQFLSVFRPIDLDEYLADLGKMERSSSGKRKEVLKHQLAWIDELSSAEDSTQRRYYLLLSRPAVQILEHQNSIRDLLSDLGRIKGMTASEMTGDDWRELLFLTFHYDRLKEGIPQDELLLPPVLDLDLSQDLKSQNVTTLSKAKPQKHDSEISLNDDLLIKEPQDV